MNDGATLVARILLAQMFIMSGMHKLGAGYIGTQAYMQSFHVPGFLLPLVIAVEIGGGLAIAAGFFTRRVALVLAGFTLATALVFHSHLSDPTQAVQFMKNLAITGGFVLLALHGPGAYSVDRRYG